MAIEFVVEDGTNKSDATSYTTVEFFRQYWENRGVDYSVKTDAEVQAKLNVATQYLDNLYTWKGYKETGSQALEFPRDWLYDRNGYDQAGVVPDALQKAVCEAAAYELDGKVLEDVALSIQSRSMGPVSVSYGRRGALPPKIVKVEKYIGDFVDQLHVGL